MTAPKEQEDSLSEWNRLNKTNAENALASAMFAGLLSTSPIIDTFSVWLLAGSGATAALMVANADKIIPFLGQSGFKISGVALVLSALFGVLSKARAVQCQIGYGNQQKITELMKPILDNHLAHEEKINEAAASRGISLATAVDLERVTSEFTKYFPKWAGWLVRRHLSKHAGDPQLGYLLPVRYYMSQSRFAFFQVLGFIAFFCIALAYAQPV
jgi:hypothetical protein